MLKRFALVALLLAATTVGVLLVMGLGETRLPEPSGPYRVGRTSRVWRNHAAPAPPTAADAPSAELVGWIWYPVERDASAPPLPYLPPEWLAVVRSIPFPLSLLTRDVARVHGHSIDAPLAARRVRYPIVILRGGLGAMVVDYTTIAEGLASHGFVVVGFDAPYRTGVVAFPDGRVVLRPAANNPETVPREAQPALAARLLAGWAADTRFVLDELARLDAADPAGLFTGRLDLEAIGVAGHSLGGATALQVCHEDARCKAAIDIDGAPLGDVVRTGIDRPVVFLLSDHDTSSAEARSIVSAVRSIHDRAPAGERHWWVIRGTSHFNFSDQALTRNAVVFRLAGALGPIDRRRALEITIEAARRFLAVYLEQAPESLLEVSGELPEVVAMAR